MSAPLTLSDPIPGGRGRDDHRWSPPRGSARALISACGSYRGWIPAKRGAGPHTRPPMGHAQSRSMSGTCRVGECSPWSAAFPPHSPLTGLPSLFEWFIGTMPLSDSSQTCTRAVRPEPSPAVLRLRFTAGISEVSRFSCMKFLGVPGAFDYAGPTRARAIAIVRVAFRTC